MSDNEPTWHLGRYVKPGEYVKCHFCGTLVRPDEVETFGDRKVCHDRIWCDHAIEFKRKKREGK